MSQTLLHSRQPIIPAVLDTSESEFAKKLEFARKVGAAHLDVIDQGFVDGAALPIDRWPSIDDIEYTEAHLMVERPIEFLEKLAQKGIGRAIIHIESEFDLEQLQQKARELDILLGYAINPDTDLLKVKPLLNTHAYIQLMGVNPGHANQEMIDLTPMAVNYIQKSTVRQIFISVDGGVTEHNIPKLRRAGAQYFVSTHALFASDNWQENYDRLLAAAKGDEV